MAMTPKYYRQQRLPGRLGAPAAQPYSPADRSLTRFGNIVEYAGLQLKKRHDEAKITTGYNEFRDIARKKLSELLALQGENATGLGEQYDEWFNDFSSDYMQKRLGNDTQRRGWEGLTLTKRGHDLDILARHEAQEMHRFRAQAEAGMFTTTLDDITSNPFDDRSREASIDIFMEKVRQLHPGEDVTALEDKYEKQVYGATLQSMINDDPGRAAGYLEAWKNIIGPDEYKRLKGQLDEGVSNQNVETAYVKLEQMFGDNPQAKLKYIRQSKNYKKLGLDLTEREKLKTIYTGEYNNNKALREESEKNRDEQDVLALQDALLVDKNVKNAWNIANDMQNPNLRGRALALVENQKFASDPAIYTSVKRLVNLDPSSIDATDIWNHLPSAPGEPGINADDLQALHQRWQSLMKEAAEKPDKYALRGRYLQMIDHLRSKGVFSPADARENEVIWGRLVDEWNDLFDAKPDLTDRQAEEWFTQRTSEYKDSFIMWLIDSTVGRLVGKRWGEGHVADLPESERLGEDAAIAYFAFRGKGIPNDPVKEYNRLIDKAVRLLEKNNKQVTPDTVRQVMEQFDDAY